MVSLGATHSICNYHTVAGWERSGGRNWAQFEAILMQLSEEIDCEHQEYVGKRDLSLELLALLTGKS